MPVELSYQIDPLLLAVIAGLVSFGLGFRAFRGKDWARLGDMVPRLFIMGIYILFEANPSISADERSIWVRYGLFSLLVVELIYLLLRMYWKIQSKRQLEGVMDEEPNRLA